jgi:2-phospho-L-lactate guanylyltransferase
MVEDVLATLIAHPAFARVTLVSDDPGARLLASNYGVDFLPESSLGCSGLNAVLQAAAEQLCDPDIGELVVLHGDIPLLNASDLDAALALWRDKGGLVVGCDRHGIGTNLLVSHGAEIPRFHFGADSCARHQAWAETAGLPATVLTRTGIGLDIDELEDIQLLLASAPDGSAGRTLHMLHDSGLAMRLALTLGESGADLQRQATQQ